MPNPKGFDFSSRTLLAQLTTEVIIDGETYRCLPGGTRDACVERVSTSFDPARNAEITTLAPGIAFFSTDDWVLGKIRVFNDPRVTLPGTVIYSRDADGNAAAPALGSFYHAMVFHIIPHDGNAQELWLYSGVIWEVHAALDAFPPINTQYYHGPSVMPLYDLISGQPSSIRKGVSTIALGGIATSEQQSHWRGLYDAEVAVFNALPTKMAPPSMP